MQCLLTLLCALYATDVNHTPSLHLCATLYTCMFCLSLRCLASGGVDNTCIMPQEGLFLDAHVVPRWRFGRKAVLRANRKVSVPCPRTSTAVLVLENQLLKEWKLTIPPDIATRLARNGCFAPKVCTASSVQLAALCCYSVSCVRVRRSTYASACIVAIVTVCSHWFVT